jgi:NAD(P)H-dependent FMN reductase
VVAVKIQIILGSTRQGRVIEPVGKWVSNALNKLEVEVETVDLADFDLPMFDEPISPRYNPNRIIDPKVKPFLDKLAEADGYVFITPEYNHSIPAVLKNAFDYITFELQKKPAAIVSYGTVGGARAAEHLKAILIEAKAAVVPEATALLNPTAILDEKCMLDEESLANPWGPQAALTTTVTELVWWTSTLKVGRKELVSA